MLKKKGPFQFEAILTGSQTSLTVIVISGPESRPGNCGNYISGPETRPGNCGNYISGPETRPGNCGNYGIAG